jgi:hypothetical protein
MRGGVAISECIDTRRSSVADVVSLAAEAIRTCPGYRLLQTSPSSMQALRRARPSFWSLSRQTETLLLEVAPRAGRVVIDVSGRGAPELVARLRSIAAAPAGSGAPSPLTDRAPIPAPGAGTFPGAAPPPEAQAATVLRADLPFAPTAVRAELRLLDGRIEPIDCRLVVGRDPARSATVGPQRRLEIDDPTVSKTHCEIWAEAGTVYVLDCHSTNGTSHVSVGGQQVVLTPGRATAVALGATVLIGGVGVEIGERRNPV